MTAKYWALFFCITLAQAFSAQYQQLDEVITAYQNPDAKNIAKAKLQLARYFGKAPQEQEDTDNQLNSNYFQVSWKFNSQTVTLHSLAVKSLQNIATQLIECDPKLHITVTNDSILKTHQQGLIISINSEKACVHSLLLENGFYSFKENYYTFLALLTTQEGRCPIDMVRTGDFCIDRYEAPNIVGVKPHVATKAKEAIVYCQMQGKQLCSDKMWEQSCSNNATTTYAYGNTYKEGTCNDDKIWRSVDWKLVNRYNPQHPLRLPNAKKHVDHLNQADPSGSRSKCHNDQGVFDLLGNASEWVLNTRGRASSANGKVYSVAMKGCFWSKCYRGIKPKCSFTNPNHGKSFRSYEAGFRCCLNLEQ